MAASCMAVQACFVSLPCTAVEGQKQNLQWQRSKLPTEQLLAIRPSFALAVWHNSQRMAFLHGHALQLSSLERFPPARCPSSLNFYSVNHFFSQNTVQSRLLHITYYRVIIVYFRGTKPGNKRGATQNNVDSTHKYELLEVRFARKLVQGRAPDKFI